MTWAKKVLKWTAYILGLVGSLLAGVWLGARRKTKPTQAGDVTPIPGDTSGVPTQADCADWLKGKRIIAVLILSSALLSIAGNLSAEFNVTNAVKGMYEYSQFLNGSSVDKITNVIESGGGVYFLYLDMSVLRWPPEDGIRRHIARIIPMRVPQTTSPWIVAGIGFLAGALAGIVLSK